MKKMRGWLLALLCLALCANGAALAEAQGGYTIDGEPYTVSPTIKPDKFRSEGYEYMLQEDDTAVITGYYGEETAIEIPFELDGHAVTAIGDEAFRRNSQLTSAYIPGNVLSVGARAFAECRALTDIYLINGIVSLGDAVFYRCYSLETVSIPASVTSVGVNPFADCARLTRILVSEENTALEMIDDVLFTKEDKRLVCFPKGLLSVYNYRAPEETKTIGTGAFYGCSSLMSVTLPEGLTRIGNEAFYDCSALTSLTLPGSLEEIGSYAFYSCGSLLNLTLPEAVQSIGDRAFLLCLDIKLTVERGSYAERYCQSNELSFTYADA